MEPTSLFTLYQELGLIGFFVILFASTGIWFIRTTLKIRKEDQARYERLLSKETERLQSMISVVERNTATNARMIEVCESLEETVKAEMALHKEFMAYIKGRDSQAGGRK